GRMGENAAAWAEVGAQRLTPTLGDSSQIKHPLRRFTSCRLLRSYIGSGDPLVARRTGGHDDEGMATNIAARLRRHGGGGSSAPQPYADSHAARQEHRAERQTLGGGAAGRRIRGAPEELPRRRGEAEHDARGITDGL